MAEVYWIRKPEHTDVFTQGYVGVTTKTAQERFQGHIYTAFNRREVKSIVHKAIIAIGPENLVLETICICEEDYAYVLENKLRPSKLIGWNVAIGGSKPPGVKGLPVSEETRKKLSKANKGRKQTDSQKEALRKANIGRKRSPEHKAKISEYLSNRPVTQKMIDRLIAHNKSRVGERRSDESKNKQSSSIKANGYWNTKRANRSLWEQADKFYQEFITGLRQHYTEKKYCLNIGCLRSIFKHFKDGWIPAEDERWVADFVTDLKYGE